MGVGVTPIAIVISNLTASVSGTAAIWLGRWHD